MNNKYKAFFGFTKTPFHQDIAVKNLMQTKQLNGVVDRIKYAVELGAAAIVTGDIGAGKSSAFLSLILSPIVTPFPPSSLSSYSPGPGVCSILVSRFS